MKEQLRDKTRDELAEHLNTIGIDAVLSARGRPHEDVGNKWWRRSLGVIDLSGGPIGWINVIKKDRSDKSPPRWWMFLGVPDSREIPESRSVNIKTKRKKSFPIFGKVIGVTWKGSGHGQMLAHELSIDQEIDNLAAEIGNLRVETLHGDFSGWTIEVDRKIAPTKSQWAALEKIAGICTRTSTQLPNQPSPPPPVSRS